VFYPCRAPPSTTAFDPANKSASIGLSGSDLVATSTVAGWESVRGTVSHSSGKYYAEFTSTTHVGSGMEIGLVNGSFAIGTSGQFLGIDANSFGHNDSGGVFKNGSSFGTAGAFAAGNVIQMAYDATTGTVWVKVDAGSWDAAGGSDDPGSGAGGFATGLGGTAVFRPSPRSSRARCGRPTSAALPMHSRRRAVLETGSRWSSRGGYEYQSMRQTPTVMASVRTTKTDMRRSRSMYQNMLTARREPGG
jgi:hypothetical protein